MLRGLTIFAIGVGTICLLGVPAQPAAGVTLADRLRFITGGEDEPAQAGTIRDSNVRPAAGAAPRAARDAAMGGTSRQTGGGGGGFLTRFRLPSLMPQSTPRAESRDEPPMPYDPAELEAAGATPRRPSGAAPRTGAGVAAQRRTAPAAGATAGATTPPTSGAAGARGAAGATRPPVVVRTSPSTGATRHNELAEALTGLNGGEGESTSVSVEGEVTPPSATMADEETPSYLRESEAGATADAEPAPRTGGATARGPVDVRTALTTGGASAPAAGTTATTPPRGAAATRRTAPRTTAAARRSPVRAPVVETDVAAALTDEPAAEDPAAVSEEAPLGEIAADAAPPTYVAPPVVATPPVTAGAQPTKTRPMSPQTANNIRPRNDVLVSVGQPVIVSSVAGPPRIVVGRTAEYRIALENKGDEPAREVVATVAVPAWAEVVDAAASNGAVERIAAAAEGEPNTMRWQLYELAPGAAQTLTLQLIPRSGRQLQLDIAWNHAPVGGHATVEVQEPKLQMDITGPGEVLFGKSQRYTLTLTNPGTGDAEDVMIELVPPGGDPKAPVRHRVGALPAGAAKSIELELTAREAGNLQMQAAALAAGDLRIETVKMVVCRKAELDVDWRGPDKNFAGAVATYFIRVRNPGTAPADKVNVELSLPAGAELIDASAGHAWDADRRMVVWQPGALTAGEERFMQLRCRMTQPGVNEMELIARTEAGELSDVHSVPVAIEALADLKLAVSDPQGVVAVGDVALYEIRVQNRGLTAAHGVNVVALFSAGIDPSHVEGGQHEIRDGRVSFRTIDTLAAGAEVVLRIHAKATAEGTHVFRAEVVCDDLETKLAAEETTRFFVEEDRWADASAAYSEQAEGTTR